MTCICTASALPFVFQLDIGGETRVYLSRRLLVPIQFKQQEQEYKLQEQVLYKLQEQPLLQLYSYTC